MVATNSPSSLPNVGRRREGRLRVAVDATVVLLDGTCRGALVDLSCNGARVHGVGVRLRPGAEAVLKWGRREAFGMVVWAAGGAAGLLFYDPLAERIVMETRRLVDNGQLSAERDPERKLARAFVQGLTRL